MSADREKLKAAIAEFSYRENHEQPFKLASGKLSPFYCDLKQTLLQPVYLRIAAQLLWEKIKPLSPELVGGLTMGADPLVYAISMQAEKENYSCLPVIVRKEEKSHGSGNRFECLKGAKSGNKKLVLIDDVITTGGSTLKAYHALKETFAMTDAFCLVDREEGGAKLMADHNLNLQALFQIKDFKL